MGRQGRAQAAQEDASPLEEDTEETEAAPEAAAAVTNHHQETGAT